MMDQFLISKFRWRPLAGAKKTVTAAFYQLQHYHATATTINTDGGNTNEEKKTNQWLTLPAFTPTVDGSSIAKLLSGRTPNTKARTITNNMTALKWILKCCPQLPRSLVHKLFRLRQVHFLKHKQTNTYTHWSLSPAGDRSRSAHLWNELKSMKMLDCWWFRKKPVIFVY